MGEYMKKTTILKIIILFIMIVMLIVNISSAMGVSSLKGNINKTEDIKTMGNKAITTISTVGSILSVIMIIVIGIKYMIGSVEEKAEYKKTLMPFLIGSLLVFAASTIAGIVYKIAINI